MPKPFPLGLHIEEQMLGQVLRKLQGMEGVVTIDLHLHQPVPKIANGASTPPSSGRAKPGSLEKQVTQFLYEKGQQHIREVAAFLGGKVTRAHGVLFALKRKSIVESGSETATHRLTPFALQAIRERSATGDITDVLPAQLSKPEEKKTPRGKGGTTGVGVVLAKLVEAGGRAERTVLQEAIVAAGKKSSSIDGALGKGKEMGFLKMHSPGHYEITVKGTREHARHHPQQTTES